MNSPTSTPGPKHLNRYLVSACLIGASCRFDGMSARKDSVVGFLEGMYFIGACPEALGGLPTPRTPCHFEDGDGTLVLYGRARVVSAFGDDMTDVFIRGGMKCLALARRHHISYAILKERSPSCGVREIYRGADKAPGMGVTAAILKNEGIIIISDEDII